MRHWNNVLQQINAALLLETKHATTLDLAKQTLPEILESAVKNGTTDTLIYYARKIFNACETITSPPNNSKADVNYQWRQHWEPSPHPRTLPAAEMLSAKAVTEPTVWQ